MFNVEPPSLIPLLIVKENNHEPAITLEILAFSVILGRRDKKRPLIVTVLSESKSG